MEFTYYRISATKSYILGNKASVGNMWITLTQGMQNALSFLKNDFLETFVPSRCVCCSSLGVLLCEDCYCKSEISFQTCIYCKKSTLDGQSHISCTPQKGIVKTISQIKYNREGRRIINGIKLGNLKGLIDLIVAKLDTSSLEGLDYIISISSPQVRLRTRLYQPSDEIAKSLQLMLNVPVVWLFERSNTKFAQKTLNKSDRRNMVKGTFKIIQAPFIYQSNQPKNSEQITINNLEGKNVLLVDDLVTTGESMKEATRVLYSLGVSKVFAYTLCMHNEDD